MGVTAATVRRRAQRHVCREYTAHTDAAAAGGGSKRQDSAIMTLETEAAG